MYTTQALNGQLKRFQVCAQDTGLSRGGVASCPVDYYVSGSQRAAGYALRTPFQPRGHLVAAIDEGGAHPAARRLDATTGRRLQSGDAVQRVRATDPRPCPKCGKIYRSAHTLRTHMEDKHTLCPGYRCVLCGTVAKSRNSLHSHMSRQHRGISTKDLPVLPMPAPFDPELASKLLSKAGVKVMNVNIKAFM